MNASSGHSRVTILAVGLLTLSFAVRGAPGEILWQNLTGDIIFGAPAIGPGGEIVVGSEDGNVYSYNPDGSTRWIFNEAGDWIDSSPSIAEDGTVYAGAWDGFLYAIDGDAGTLKWKFETGALIIGSPAIGPDNAIYVGSNDGFLYALWPDGSQKWISDSLAGFSPINSSPVLDSNGQTVYFGNDSGEFYALDTSAGTQKWVYHVAEAHPIDPDVSHSIVGAAAIGDDGSLYFGSRNGTLYALSSTGALRWAFKAAEPIRSAPAISSSGILYFAAQDGYLYAVDSEGFQLWETFVGDVFYCSPALDAGGNVILGAYSGSQQTGASTSILGIDSSGNLLWETVIPGYNDSSPNIAPDGSIYMGSHDGYLYKVEGAYPLMSGGWPRFQANRRQTAYPPDLHKNEVIDHFPAIVQSVGGWVFVPWFGVGWLSDARIPWILHLDHGYIYLDAPLPHACWFYDPRMHSWLYAASASPNYYYRFTPGSWIYHLAGSTIKSGRWFYDFSIAAWISDAG